jgi:copper homeostasis protein CutC
MAGGGINENNVERIITATGVKNVHASLTSPVASGVDCTGASMLYKVSNLERIKEFVKIIK